MTSKIIQLKNICKIFETEDVETHALKGVNFSIAEGDFVSISGPSGCGKSTLLSIMGLLDIPSSGEYLLDGRDVVKLSLDELAAIRNEKIGFVFQSFNLIGELNVFENVALPLRYGRNNLSPEAGKERVEKCLDIVNMSHRAKHKPNQLSGGQQQRIAIARALVTKPSILLLDEPTGNLDTENSEAIINLLQELNANKTTICMVTHERHFASAAKTEIHLLDGKVKENIKKLEAVV